jgi:ATP-dependent DNA helicase RecG
MIRFVNDLEGIAKGRGTGVPKIIRAMRDNGSPAPVFEIDEDYSYFAVHPAARAAASDLGGDLHGDLHGPGTTGVSEQVTKLLNYTEGEMTRHALQAALALANRDHFRKTYLLPALEAGPIEMTLPDKPNSRSQRYRLTAVGKKMRRASGKKS